MRPKGFGIIVRTVVEGKSQEVLKADLDSLVKTWERLGRRVKKTKAPALVHKEVGVASSIIRDMFTTDINKLLVDSKKMYNEIVSYLKDVAPQLVNRVELYRKRAPIFDSYNIEADIERSLSRKVWLKSGGYIVIDHTEAMVVVDVNSGKFLGKKDHEQNILKINLEAALEIARQLRIRDIGGLVVIDFIDMTNERNRSKLYNEFKRELRKGRSQVNLAQVSEFGLIELTRERIRPALLYAYSAQCPTCDGTGRVISNATVATRIERWLKRFKAGSKGKRLELRVHPEMVDYLTAGFRSRIRKLMSRYFLQIFVVPDASLSFGDFKMISKKTKADITSTFKA